MTRKVKPVTNYDWMRHPIDKAAVYRAFADCEFVMHLGGTSHVTERTGFCCEQAYQLLEVAVVDNMKIDEKEIENAKGILTQVQSVEATLPQFILSTLKFHAATIAKVAAIPDGCPNSLNRLRKILHQAVWWIDGAQESIRDEKAQPTTEGTPS